MSDDVDRGQEAEARDRDLALQHAQWRIAQEAAKDAPSATGLCIDCGAVIEAARLRVLGGRTSRCASCAHDAERAQRRWL
ncbi:MAG: hypothetical protein GAK28_00708 [Luteibacter sp.]|uniref:TraR/DksA C4-type zinc finger protein n=1 Tax=Luteibacter sp. TaxID=1886636 RepID=UPI00137E307E|nr:TraR/DksA C4-type zinc finger protein [Luteibacter sp.]KAF1009075.1 MAG: hypothetical protein GAK28_00708 [Luteibacter sp.]